MRCNGLSSGRKFSLEQTSPVNLAVSSHQEPQQQQQPAKSPPSANVQNQQTLSEQNTINHSIASLYGPSKLSNYSQTPVNGPNAAAAAYQVLGYPNLYGPPSSVFA